MEYFLVWFMFGIAAAAIASAKGRSGFAWFCLGILIGPFALMVAAFPSLKQAIGSPTPDTHVRCPECQELVLSTARKCKHCGTKLQPEDTRTTVCKTCKRVTKIGNGKCAYCEEPL